MSKSRALYNREQKQKGKEKSSGQKSSGGYKNLAEYLNGTYGINEDSVKRSVTNTVKTANEVGNEFLTSGVPKTAKTTKTTARPDISKAVSGGGVKVGSGKSSNSVKNVGGNNSNGNKNMESRKGKKTWDPDAELARRRQEAQIAKYEKAFGRKINKGWR